MYREIRIFLPNIIMGTIMAVFVLVFTLFFKSIDLKSEFADDVAMLVDKVISMVAMSFGFSLILFWQSLAMVFFGNLEEKKIEIRYIASTPAGTKRIVFAKYILFFIFVAASMIIPVIFDLLVFHEAMFNIILFTNLIFYISAMLHIPVFIRFGKKKGTILSSGIFIGLIIAALIWLLFGDLGISQDNIRPLAEIMLSSADSVLSGKWTFPQRATVILLPVAAVLTVIVIPLSPRLYKKALEYDTDER